MENNQPSRRPEDHLLEELLDSLMTLWKNKYKHCVSMSQDHVLSFILFVLVLYSLYYTVNLDQQPGHQRNHIFSLVLNADICHYPSLAFPQPLEPHRFISSTLNAPRASAR